MKSIFLFILTAVTFSCSQPATSTKQVNSEVPSAAALDKESVQFLIDISNLAWFQAQVGQAALTKSHDEATISMAQKINKEYTRIKDRAKIVSIPYKIDMPYFLTHDQNDEVNKLKAVAVDSFDVKFKQKVRENNSLILKRCESFNVNTSDEGFADLIGFCKETISKNSP